MPGRNRRAGMFRRPYVGQGRPATLHADSASVHIIAIRSAGVVTCERSSEGSWPRRKRAMGQRALARLRSSAPPGSMGISAILAQFPFTIDVPAGTPIPL